MLKNRKFILFLNSVIASLALMFSGFRPFAVQAQAGDGLKREINAYSGKLSFIGPEAGPAVAASQALGTFLRPQDPGLALAKRFAPEFGIDSPERDLLQIKKNESDDGRVTVRYQQQYQGVPILGGELIINTNENGDLYSINGEISPDLSLATQSQIDSEPATQTALQALAIWYQKFPTDFVASVPELWIYDESLLKPSTQPAPAATLVWHMEVTTKDKSLPIRELVLVDAQSGNISLHFNKIDTAWRQKTITSMGQTTEKASSDQAPALTDNPTILFAPLVNTYTANNTSSLPGSLLCNQTDPNCTAGDAAARAAHKYTIGTYNLYAAQLNRDSIDNHGMTLVSTVHYCDEADPFFGCPYANAFWSGTQMVYGDAYGFALADDVVAHELTHGVTQYESNLFYYYQSGAINESFSDVFGEYYDQTNGLGSDAFDVKWLVGEDISGIGAIRSMSEPPAFENPDKMSSPYYYEEEADNGGVHYNSGINNKAVFLMVEGGTFNGKTVSALGWDKVGAIYYEVNANLLTSGSDYSDLYYALQQACANLIGQRGITASNCVEVKDAIEAVEMNGQPAPNFNTDAPLCSQSQANTVFYDDLESGISNWTFNNGTYTRWQYDSSYYGTYAHSGLHSLYADIQPDALTNATARLIPIVIPTNGYLHFTQAYGFESLGPGYYFDGGVLEYSTSGDGSWTDAGPLIDYNGYNSTIYTGLGNPLEGRPAFVGSSHGYISTRLNLASLAGQSVTFRWRLGLDDYGFFGSGFGWWLDDVRVYNCVTAPNPTISGHVGVAGAKVVYTDGGLKTILADGNGNYSISVASGWSGTVTPERSCYSFNPPSRSYSNVVSNQSNQNYTYTITPGCSAGVGVYDDLDAGWVYTGSWAVHQGTGPYNNTVHYTATAGNTASFMFSGTQFILSYTSNTNYGNTEVYVDGTRVGTINAFGGALQWQRTYTSPNFAPGTHIVQFRHGGTAFIDVDAIQILNTTAPGAGVYEDTHANWAYTGSWATHTGSGPSGNSVHYTSTAGEIAGFTFSGTQFILSYTSNTNYGNIQVYVDGSLLTTIEAYGGSLQWQKKYISPTISSGTHVVQVKHGGTAFIDVDAIQILEATPPGTSSYENSHANWVYTGSWAVHTGSGPSGNSVHYTSMAGAAASFLFSGTQFILSYTSNSNYGNIEVSVDGNKIATINAFGNSLQWQQTYTSPNFAPGTHVVQFKHGGVAYIDVDAIQILNTNAPGVGTYEDTHANWAYTGSWATHTGSGPSGNSVHYTGTPGDSAAFTFSGTQFVLSYTSNTNYGNLQVYVDGTRVGTINAFGGALQWQQTYTSPNFAPGTHVVKFRHGGTAYIDVDAIQILNTTAPGAGTYEDMHANWAYTGSWAIHNGAGPSGNSVHYTATAGEIAGFTFSGTQFILKYTSNTNYGNIQVYVDGSLVTTIDAYSASLQWQKTYTSPTYASGTHLVQFKHGGVAYIDVDAIQVLN